jgi:hypothetical protein
VKKIGNIFFSFLTEVAEPIAKIKMIFVRFSIPGTSLVNIFVSTFYNKLDRLLLTTLAA